MRSRAALTTGVVVQRYLETIAQHQRQRSFKATERYLTCLWGLLEEIPRPSGLCPREPEPWAA